MIMYSAETLEKVSVKKMIVGDDLYEIIYPSGRRSAYIDLDLVNVFFFRSRAHAKKKLLENLHAKLEHKLAEIFELNKQIAEFQQT